MLCHMYVSDQIPGFIVLLSQFFCVICANFILHPLVLANSSQLHLSNPTHCMLMNNIKIHQIRFFSNDIMLTIWNSQNAEENYCCLQETVVAGGENANIPFCCITWCPISLSRLSHEIPQRSF